MMEFLEFGLVKASILGILVTGLAYASVISNYCKREFNAFY